MLTDAQCRNANGAPRWFAKCRVQGQEKRLPIGNCPSVGLTTKRKTRDAAKLRKAAGIDPLQPQKMGKLKASSTGGDTFKEIVLPRARQAIGELAPWPRRPDETAP